MFQNGFQGGTHFEIFDPKDAMNKGNKEKEKFYQQLFKVNAPPHCQKVFDKQLKNYIFEIDGHNTKMQIPRDDRAELGLVQQYLALQVLVPHGQAWNLELVITDTTKTKRRIMLTSSTKQVEKKFFHVKVPIDTLKRGVWLNLCIDVWSFMEAWKGQTFRTLDMIIISSPCKLRKIFLLKSPVDENEEELCVNKINCQPVPKNVNFPQNFPYSNQLMTYQTLTESQYIPENIDIGASQSLADEQAQSSAQNFKNVAFGSSSNSQQKSSGFKKKTPQFQEKTARGNSLDRAENHEENNSQKNKQLGQSKALGKQKNQPQSTNEFHEVEENIEEENIDELENEFEQQGDDLNQFQQESYNDERDAVGLKIQNKHNKVGLQKKYSGQSEHTNQTAVVRGQNQNLLITNIDVNKQNKQPRTQKSPLNFQNNDPKKEKSNPWNKNKEVVQERASIPKISVNNKKSDQKQKPQELGSDFTRSQNSSSVQRKQQQNQNHLVSKDSEYEESTEALTNMDVQQTQKKQFLTKGNIQPKPFKKTPNINPQNKEQKLQIQRTTSNEDSQMHSPQNYYQMTQKFSTITDTMAFRLDDDQTSQIGQANGKSAIQDDEIEENIMIEPSISIKNQDVSKNKNSSNTQNILSTTPDNNEFKAKQFTQQGFNKRSISELKPSKDDSETLDAHNNDELEDSLEMPPPTSSYGKQAAYTYSQNKWKMKQQDESGTTFTDGFYANQLKKYTEINHRPFTPDYESTSNLGHLNSKAKTLNQPIEEEQPSVLHNEEQMVEVVYDPVMNCYFDPQTNQYYELKDG